MKIGFLFILVVLSTHLKAVSEVDLAKFAELIRFPGLPLEAIDNTQRESKVRKIEFGKVLYLKVADRKFDYAAAIYVSPINSIDVAKYDKIRNMIVSADAARRAQLAKIGFAHLPETDDAVVCFDEIKISQHIPSRSNKGGEWITPYVGGLSITCRSEELGIDYQIFLFGELDSDPEILEKYRKDSKEPSPEEFLGYVKELVQLVRESPAVLSHTKVHDSRPLKGNDINSELPGTAKESGPRPPYMPTQGATDAKSGATSISLAPHHWMLGLIFVLVVVWLISRHHPRRSDS